MIGKFLNVQITCNSSKFTQNIHNKICITGNLGPHLLNRANEH